jgi:TPR repeat protein
MKLCAACSQELPRDNFSKKQWQLKQQRRCKECIAVNRAMNLEAHDHSPPQPPSSTNSEVASCVTDKDLFKQLPPRDECPICFLQLPVYAEEQKYQACCGKTLCMGCIYAVAKQDNRELCPFCRTPEANSDGELVERMKKRADLIDASAIHRLGSLYYSGDKGLRQNRGKAIKLWLRAGELGHSTSFHKVASAYYNGEGVQRDTKKAKHYEELSAKGGDLFSIFNLGGMEMGAGNWDRAVKYWMIAAGAGHHNSLSNLREAFLDGYATKDNFEKALRAHKESEDEMKSDQREAAAERFHLRRHRGRGANLR